MMNSTTLAAPLLIRSLQMQFLLIRRSLIVQQMCPSLKLDGEMEQKREVIVRSFSLARDLYQGGHGNNIPKESELEAGAEFLESNKALSPKQKTRLEQMGVVVRNASFNMEELRPIEEREKQARNVIGKMSVEQLSDLTAFYHMMGWICNELLETKLQGIENELKC